METCEVDEQSLKALRDALESRPLALLGAGTSVDSGYPDWSRLLATLEREVHGRISPKYQSYLRLLNDPAWQAEEYRRAMGEHTFCNLIASEFAPRGRIGPVLQAIVRMNFRHVLTTNYDICIETAYREAGQPCQTADWNKKDEVRRFFRDLTRPGVQPYVVHLHGCYYDPGNVILTESSYAARYVQSDDAARKLFAIFITQPVVFIGFSVNDPDLNQLMREANASLGGGNPQHLALVGFEVDEQKELIRNRFEGKFGISPVFYRVTRNGDGSENHHCLAELLSRACGVPLPVAVSAPADTPETPDRAATAARAAEAGVDTPPAPSSAPVDPLDQQKGRWGGLPEQNDRRLRVENVREQGETFAFDLVVEAADPATKPLEGEVVFHLHHTFYEPEVTEPVVEGRATLSIDQAYGVFTVGAVADGGATTLELDLATLDVFPDWFRAR